MLKPLKNGHPETRRMGQFIIGPFRRPGNSRSIKFSLQSTIGYSQKLAQVKNAKNSRNTSIYRLEKNLQVCECNSEYCATRMQDQMFIVLGILLFTFGCAGIFMNEMSVDLWMKRTCVMGNFFCIRRRRWFVCKQSVSGVVAIYSPLLFGVLFCNFMMGIFMKDSKRKR